MTKQASLATSPRGICQYVINRDFRFQAAVISGSRLLLLRCQPHNAVAFWVLPGGGREAEESDRECVAREAREEAGVDVAVGSLLYEMAANPPDGTYTRWRTYQCHITRGEPQPGGGEDWAVLTAVRWLALDQPETWEDELLADRFLLPQILKIRHALGYGPMTMDSQAE